MFSLSSGLSSRTELLIYKDGRSDLRSDLPELKYTVEVLEHASLELVWLEWGFVFLESQLVLNLVLVQIFGVEAQQVAPAFNVKLLNDHFEVLAASIVIEQFRSLADHIFE